MKIISYDVEIKSTKINRTFTTPKVYTNDLNSVVFQFNVLDMTAEELTGATATTLLYMNDGSFFQNPSADIGLVGNVFSYALKESEGNHGGLAQIQLVVKIATKEYATQLYNFEVVRGLETKVAQEVMIHDWTTLTRDARAYIDQFVADEAVRQQQFETAEANRTTEETNRVSAEQGRATTETERINAEISRASAESGRVLAEQTRVSAESIRAEFYEGFDGRLDDLEADKKTLKNELINGDFSAGITNWSPFHSTVEAQGKVLTMTSKGDMIAPYVVQYTDVVGEDIFYATAKVRPRQSVKSIYLQFGSIQQTIVLAPTTNEYTSLSFRNKKSGTTAFFAIRTEMNSIIEGIKLDIKEALFINLTATFGAGNEPTKSEMDELINITGYFDEITLTQKQLLNWQLKLMRQNRNALIELGGTII